MHVQIVSNPAPDTREMTGPAEPLVSGSPIELKRPSSLRQAHPRRGVSSSSLAKIHLVAVKPVFP